MWSARDTQTGDQALLQFRFHQGGGVRAVPARMACPPGACDAADHRGRDRRGGLADHQPAGHLSTGATLRRGRERRWWSWRRRCLHRADGPPAGAGAVDELTRAAAPHGRLSDTASHGERGLRRRRGRGPARWATRESDLDRPQGGAVFIFKGCGDGAAGAPTWVLTGTSDTAQFGAELAAGDLDGDGRAELAVSSPGADVTVADSGAVYLYTIRRQRAGAAPAAPLTGTGRGNFGTGLAIADIDGDGERRPARGLAQWRPGDLPMTQRGVIDLFLAAPGQAGRRSRHPPTSGTDLAADGTAVNKASTNSAPGARWWWRTSTATGASIWRRWAGQRQRCSAGLALVEGAARRSPSTSRARRPSPFVARRTSTCSRPTSRTRPRAPGGWASSPPAAASCAAAGGGGRRRLAGLERLGGVKSGGQLRRRAALRLGAVQATPRAAGPNRGAGGPEGRATRASTATRPGSARGRSFAVADVDGVAGPELLLRRAVRCPRRAAQRQRAPPASCWSTRWTGSPGAPCSTSRPRLRAGGAKSDCLGAALAAWALPSRRRAGGAGLARLHRAGAFTGRIDFSPAQAAPRPLDAQSIAVVLHGPASSDSASPWRRPGSRGKTVRAGGRARLLRPGPVSDGNDFGAGRALRLPRDRAGRRGLVAARAPARRC